MCREYGGDAPDREDSMKRYARQLSGLVVVPLLHSLACGYHTAGHAAQLPESVKTIAIPSFKNETLTYRIEQMLTASVVREFNTRTRYHIVNDPGDDADATCVERFFRRRHHR